MEEILNVYTRDGKLIGTRTREECHSKNPGFYHKPAWTWIYNSNGEILVQKRASSKKTLPNYWDMPCAGHVVAGETSIQGAIREAKEEIGLDIKEEECKFMFEYIQENCWEIGQVFFVKIDKNIEDFILKEDEVSEVKWLSFEEFKKMLYSKEWVPYDEEYKDMIIKKLEELIK